VFFQYLIKVKSLNLIFHNISFVFISIQYCRQKVGQYGIVYHEINIP